MDTSGFYRVSDGLLQYAPNFVHGPNYNLFAEQKDTYVYPIEGWSWYVSEDAAITALNYVPPVEEPV